MSKGISPLIAGVLLVAFTVSVAMLAGPFFSDIMQSSQEDQKEQLDTIESSMDRNFEHLSSTYSTDSDTLEVTFRNSGNANISEYAVTAFGDSSAQATFNETLDPAELYTVNLSVSSTPERVKIEALNSPTTLEVDLSSEDNFVTGAAPSSPTGLTLSD